jgi:hypothetical protein
MTPTLQTLMQKLRLILSAVFLVFLFLPLSQCSSIEEDAGSDAEATVAATPSEPETFVPIENLDSDLWGGVLTIGSFLLPLLTCLWAPRSYKLKLSLNLAQLAAVSWFIYMIYSWVYSEFREPLLAGHVLAAMACVFWCLSVAGLAGLARRSTA